MYSKITTSSAPSEIQGEDGTIIIDKISQIRQLHLQKNGIVEPLGDPNNPDDLHDETCVFVNIIQTQDFALRDKLLENSRIVMEILQEARHQIGIKFPADGASR